ncbi:hypothetical protein Scep_010008 [Stephania cephalantha]|uniref:Uncharacterized protein n=1 Tax=Stephania cephalantha TaxID=152367 RepID=A0AAP0JWP7_9MAGN
MWHLGGGVKNRVNRVKIWEFVWKRNPRQIDGGCARRTLLVCDMVAYADLAASDWWRWRLACKLACGAGALLSSWRGDVVSEHDVALADWRRENG